MMIQKYPCFTCSKYLFPDEVNGMHIAHCCEGSTGIVRCVDINCGCGSYKIDELIGYKFDENRYKN